MSAWKESEIFDPKRGMIVFELRSCMGQQSLHSIPLTHEEDNCPACGSHFSRGVDGKIDVDATIEFHRAAMEQREQAMIAQAQQRGVNVTRIMQENCTAKEHTHGQ